MKEAKVKDRKFNAKAKAMRIKERLIKKEMKIKQVKMIKKSKIGD